MKPAFPSKTEFDALRPALDALTRDWVERECSSFDEAVDRAAGTAGESDSIWDMPAIDSKRVAGLLAELEPLLGCKLPSSLAKAGGYEDGEELIADLFTKIREKCGDEQPEVDSHQPNSYNASTAIVQAHP